MGDSHVFFQRGAFNFWNSPFLRTLKVNHIYKLQAHLPSRYTYTFNLCIKICVALKRVAILIYLLQILNLLSKKLGTLSIFSCVSFENCPFCTPKKWEFHQLNFIPLFLTIFAQWISKSRNWNDGVKKNQGNCF